MLLLVGCQSFRRCVRIRHFGSAHCYYVNCSLQRLRHLAVVLSCGLSVCLSVAVCTSSNVSSELDSDACLGQCLLGVTVVEVMLFGLIPHFLLINIIYLSNYSVYNEITKYSILYSTQYSEQSWLLCGCVWLLCQLCLCSATFSTAY